VRPDRTVLHDGPLTKTQAIVHESLALLGCGVASTVPLPPPVPS
jgi:hypothetical protein